MWNEAAGEEGAYNKNAMGNALQARACRGDLTRELRLTRRMPRVFKPEMKESYPEVLYREGGPSS